MEKVGILSVSVAPGADLGDIAQPACHRDFVFGVRGGPKTNEAISDVERGGCFVAKTAPRSDRDRAAGGKRTGRSEGS